MCRQASAHLALHGLPQQDGPPQSLVVHLDQVPALVAALTAAADRLTQVWHDLEPDE